MKPLELSEDRREALYRAYLELPDTQRAEIVRGLRALAGIPQLTIEDRDAVLTALEACAGGMDFALRRRAGYSAALQAAGLETDPALMRSEEMTEGYGHRAAMEMLRGDAPPTAFLTSSLIIALGVRRAVEELGLKMGRDVSIVTHDDELSYLRNGEDIPIYTAVRSSVREAGRMAAEMLIRRIADPTLPHLDRLLEAELTIGQSTGPAPDRN